MTASWPWVTASRSVGCSSADLRRPVPVIAEAEPRLDPLGTLGAHHGPRERALPANE